MIVAKRRQGFERISEHLILIDLESMGDEVFPMGVFCIPKLPGLD
jgi:hypothetical protein